MSSKDGHAKIVPARRGGNLRVPTNRPPPIYSRLMAASGRFLSVTLPIMVTFERQLLVKADISNRHLPQAALDVLVASLSVLLWSFSAALICRTKAVSSLPR